MPLRLHDTRRRTKVDFTTMEPGKVSMYVCCVTVYDRCHLGHARCYLAFDLIHRWLETSGYEVHYVQNFTDIDDKIIVRANELDGDWNLVIYDSKGKIAFETNQVSRPWNGVFDTGVFAEDKGNYRWELAAENSNGNRILFSDQIKVEK